jgi:hypothetical protein
MNFRENNKKENGLPIEVKNILLILTIKKEMN